jgi:hypothetical protein
MNYEPAIWAAAIGAAGSLTSAAWAIWIERRGRGVKREQGDGPHIPFDVFLAYAWQDSSQFAQDLANALQAHNLRVWLDQEQVQMGDDLFQKIDEGMDQSRYGLVILSPHFFNSAWSSRELDALIKRESKGSPSILPIWYGVSEEDVIQHVPALASRIAIRATEEDVEEMASAIAAIARGPRQ